MLDKVSATTTLSEVLGKLDKALAAGDVDAAVELFQADCYWRDLVSFTWNIKTMEGKEQIADMLRSQLGAQRPSNWRISEGEEAAESGDLIEGWINFETAVARGFGHIRLKEGRIWTRRPPCRS